MKVITHSQEHHYLTNIEKLRADLQGWAGLYFALSRKLDHEVIISNPENIINKLANTETEAKAFCNELDDLSASHHKGFIYRFSDNDILALACLNNDDEEKKLKLVYEKLSESLPEGLHEYCLLSNEYYFFEKLADEKMLSAKRMAAYRKMSDSHLVESISVRRQRREDPLVMIVEDDRFTASYATGILNKDYDLVHAKTGEEAIILYLESAPDIIFLDVHLPGLNGHQTLSAIRKADPEAYVIMLSIDTVKANILSASSGGAQGFLKKPFSKDRLLATVQKSPFIRRIKSNTSSTRSFFT
jgi:CheY-like chemotaxis protein